MPEVTLIALTGRYESRDGACSIHINQAGRLLLGTWRFHRAATATGFKVTVQSFAATVGQSFATGASLRYVRRGDGAKVEGHMSVRRSGDDVVIVAVENPVGPSGLALRPRPLEVELVRIDPAQWLPEEALASAPTEAIAAAQKASLTRSDEARARVCRRDFGRDD